MKYKLRQSTLKRWRTEEGRTYTWLANRIRIEPRTLHEQVRGRCGVSLHVALAIEAMIGVPVRDLVEAMPSNA